MMLDFKDTGKDVYFEIQITNDDPSSDAGSQTITLYSVTLTVECLRNLMHLLTHIWTRMLASHLMILICRKSFRKLLDLQRNIAPYVSGMRGFFIGRKETMYVKFKQIFSKKQN